MAGKLVRRNERRGGCPIKGLPNGENIALNRTLSPWRTCSSIQEGQTPPNDVVAPSPRWSIVA